MVKGIQPARRARGTLLGLALAGLLMGCRGASPAPPSSAPTPHFVGNQACVSCHEKQTSDWQSSHHAASMQAPTSQTVLGNFDNQSFTHGGVTSQFWRKGEEFWVTTDGPDGQMRDFPVRYTFGVYPLQQYLLPLDRGRLQALNVVWDCRPKAEGGQRWFHLFPEDKMDHSDILHWTGLYQNWNHMCADCHSTGVNKGFDAAPKTFDTRWAEINVGCESCHGPGSSHQEWAQPAAAQRPNWRNKGLLRSLGQPGQWLVSSGNTPPLPSSSGSHSEVFLESCAPCHTRRAPLTQQPRGMRLLDDYQPTTLEAPNYEADGQIKEEVFEFGAFQQSKMHARGVTCRDCHDSHSLKLKASGNSLCVNCHEAERLGAYGHTHHSLVGEGSSCLACHMPEHTYMGVHRRHDHSFRVPRPDMTKLGVPNACTTCHADHPASWAAEAVERWYGPERKGLQTYTAAFAAARAGKPEAAELLTAIAADSSVPALARATALAEIGQDLTERSLLVVEKGLVDPNPAVRLEAVQALSGLPVTERWKRAEALLKDPYRAVRLQATRVLGAAPPSQLGAEHERALQRPIQELQASAAANADRPEAHAQMGVFHASREEFAEAEREYRAAIEIEPRLTHNLINLADLYRSMGRDEKGEKLLTRALTTAPADADLHHALGLVLVRRKKIGAALRELQEAARLAPNNTRYGYVLSVAQDSLGQREQALKSCRAVLKRHPQHVDTLFVAVRLAALTGKTLEAQEYGGRLQQMAKHDPRIQARLHPPR